MDEYFKKLLELWRQVINMNVLVLGANGFVGTNICKCLEENKILYQKAPRRKDCDLRDMESTLNLFSTAKPNFIINCAAHVGSLNYVTQQAADVITNNAKMILTMYEAIAKACPKAIVVNPIANCAYPGNLDTFTEDHWQNGELHRSVLSYGATRRFMWAVSECFGMQHRVRSISLMVPNMYGPYDSTDPNKAHALNALISKFVKAEYTGQKQLEIWGTGIAIREWLYAMDFARIIVKIIKNPNMLGLDEPVNIAQNFGLSVRELLHLIESNFTYSGEIVFNPNKPDGAPKKVMDDRKFRKIFSNFKFTELDQGIGETIKYYKSILPY